MGKLDLVRIATKNDAERIAMLHAESWRTAYRGIYRDEFLDHEVIDDRLREWQERFADPSPARHTILIERDEALAGFICVFGDDDPTWGSLVDNLHVTPRLKRGGLGAILLREGARWLAEYYARSPVYLWALEKNEPARRFYEKLGGHMAEIVEFGPSERHPGIRSCRYVWETPNGLYGACQAQADRPV